MKMDEREFETGREIESQYRASSATPERYPTILNKCFL
jgi:hypothetical protein